MPSGVILSSGSEGATAEDVRKVLTNAGLEVDEPEQPEPAPAEVEPKRDDFESDEEFEEAHVAWKDKQEPPKEAAEEEEEEEESAPPPRKLSRTQRIVERATAPLRQEIESLRKRLEGAEPSKAPVEPNPRPKRAEFDSDEKYEDALLAWGVEKASADQKAKAAVDEQKEFLETNLKNYRVQVEKFRDAHEDWDEVVNQDIPMHREVQLAVIEQENGAQVIYYLGKHPQFTAKLAEMSPLKAVMEVGALSKRLLTGVREARTSNGGEQPKPRPRIPEPVRRISAAVTSSALTSRDAAKKGDFQAFKSAQRAGR